MQELTDLIELLKGDLDMDYLALAKDIGNAHYATLKQDPPPLPVRQESAMLRLRDMVDGHPRFRDIMGCVLEIEAAAWIRGAKDGLHE